MSMEARLQREEGADYRLRRDTERLTALAREALHDCVDAYLGTGSGAQGSRPRNLREVDILADELEERALAALSSPGPTPDPVGEASRALRTASLLEQVASCAASIDSAARSLASKRPSKLPKDLGEMARVALGLLDGALLPAGGWELARSQRERDLLKQVARLSESLSLECFQRMASDPSAIPACKCHLLVARKLEIVANAAAETARLGDTG